MGPVTSHSSFLSAFYQSPYLVAQQAYLPAQLSSSGSLCQSPGNDDSSVCRSKHLYTAYLFTWGEPKNGGMTGRREERRGEGILFRASVWKRDRACSASTSLLSSLLLSPRRNCGWGGWSVKANCFNKSSRAYYSTMISISFYVA